MVKLWNHEEVEWEIIANEFKINFIEIMKRSKISAKVNVFIASSDWKSKFNSYEFEHDYNLNLNT